MSTENLRRELLQVAAVAVAIVQDLDYGSTEDMWDGGGNRNSRTEKVLAEVGHERSRQEVKWGPQHLTPLEWLAVLGEEFGEAASEITDPEEVWGLRLLQSSRAIETASRHFLKERFGPDPQATEGT